MMELLHSNIWWLEGLELINNGFAYAKAHDLYCRGIQCVDDIWDTENCTFIVWDEAQVKFKLTYVENEDWVALTSKLVDKWRHLLEKT